MAKFLMRVFTTLHARILKRTGWLGGGSDAGSVLALEHVGAKTGTHRITPLVFMRHGDAYVVCGSMGGAPQNPRWYYNLLANPDTTITVAKRSIPVRARELAGEERDEAWARFTAHDDRWSQYETRTERRMPLIALDPK